MAKKNVIQTLLFRIEAFFDSKKMFYVLQQLKIKSFDFGGFMGIILYFKKKETDYMHLNFLSVLRAASGGIIGHRAP